MIPGKWCLVLFCFSLNQGHVNENVAEVLFVCAILKVRKCLFDVIPNSIPGNESDRFPH